MNQSLPQDVDANGVPIVDVDNNPVTIRYPNTNLGNRLKAAIRLAITNPDRRDQPAPSTCLRNVKASQRDSAEAFFYGPPAR